MAYRPPYAAFNVDRFSAGATVGATVIAAALVSGCAAARAANWVRWSRDALIGAIEYGELQRARLFDALQDANRMISRQEREIIELRSELRVAQARAR